MSNDPSLQESFIANGSSSSSSSSSEDEHDDISSKIIDNPLLAAIAPLGDPKHSHNTLNNTVLAYVCTCAGAGIISLPYALAKSGWLGLLTIIITSFICVQTGNWLLACLLHAPNVTHTMRSYEDVGVAAFGRNGRIMVALFQNITLFGVASIFLIIAATNLHSLIDDVSLKVWLLLCAVVLIPASWKRTVKEAKWLAIFGFAASLLVGAVVIITGLQAAFEQTRPEPVSRPLAQWDGISTCINIVVFSLGSHSVMPGQVSELTDARNLYKTFTMRSYLIIGTVYALVAACGFLGWGTACQDNILNSIGTNINSSDSTAAQLAVTISRVAIVAHVLLAYILPLNPVALFVEEQIKLDDMVGPRKRMTSIVVRTSLVIASMLVALFLPYLGSILSLVSALSIVAVALVLPPVFYYVLFREQGIPQLELAKMGIVIVIGVCSCVIGLYFATTSLIADVQANS